MKRRAALGLKVRIGRAVIVAVGGPAEAPEILAKTRIDVATTFDEGAVFHVVQQLPIDEARARVRDAERRFIRQARAALGAFVAELDVAVVAAGMAAAAAKTLPAFEVILKAHPLVHAAEGELYRRVFAQAAGGLDVPPARLPPDTLTTRLTSALGFTPAKLTARLSAMGKASGRPWAVDQKEATLAAWVALLGVARGR